MSVLEALLAQQAAQAEQVTVCILSCEHTVSCFLSLICGPLIETKDEGEGEEDQPQMCVALVWGAQAKSFQESSTALLALVSQTLEEQRALWRQERLLNQRETALAKREVTRRECHMSCAISATSSLRPASTLTNDDTGPLERLASLSAEPPTASTTSAPL